VPSYRQHFVKVPGALVSYVMKNRTSDSVKEDVRLTWLN
jgi:hypothetical protein